MTDILPTHQCFDDAIERLGELARENQMPTLVHGICTADDGTPYAHAWVENRGLVWDAGLLNGQRVSFAVPVLEYWSAKRVGRTWRYTVIEMLRANRAHGTFGPWVPELIEMCTDSPRILGRIQATYRPKTSK